MGLAGIILFISAVAIALFIVVDTYLGTPPKPKALVAAIIVSLIGIVLIVWDANLEPRVSKVELTTEDIEIIEDMETDDAKKVEKPVKIIVTRDVYPWYSLFNKDRIRMKAMGVENKEEERAEMSEDLK